MHHSLVFVMIPSLQSLPDYPVFRFGAYFACCLTSDILFAVCLTSACSWVVFCVFLDFTALFFSNHWFTAIASVGGFFTWQVAFIPHERDRMTKTWDWMWIKVFCLVTQDIIVSLWIDFMRRTHVMRVEKTIKPQKWPIYSMAFCLPDALRHVFLVTHT